MTTYFRDKKYKLQRKYQKNKMLTTIFKPLDTFIIIATTSSSFSLSFTVNGLIVIPMSTGIAFGLTISNKVIYEIVIEKITITKNKIKKINKLVNILIN